LAGPHISAVWPGEGLRSMPLWSRQPNRAARSAAATATTCDHWLLTLVTFSSNVVELIDPTRQVVALVELRRENRSPAGKRRIRGLHADRRFSPPGWRGRGPV